MAGTKDGVKASERRKSREVAGLCVRCGETSPEPGKKSCESCLERQRQACKGWYEKKPKTYHAARNGKYVATNRARVNEVRRSTNSERRKTLRDAVFEKYGRECDCCGEKDFRFLTVDHVNGGGNKEVAQIGNMGLLRRLAKEPKNSAYRILCYNCNCGRKNYDGVCPHELRREAADEGPIQGSGVRTG